MVLFTIVAVVLGYLIYSLVRPWVIFLFSLVLLIVTFVLLTLGKEVYAEAAASNLFVLNVVGFVYSLLYPDLPRWWRRLFGE